MATAAPSTKAGWYDLPNPGPATEQVLDFEDVDLKPIPVQGKAAPGDPDGAALRNMVEEIVSIAHKNRPEGNKLWGRMSGSESEVQTMKYAADKLRDLGINDIEEATYDQYAPYTMPTSWSLRMTGAGEPVTLQSATPMEIGEEATGVADAPLIYVGRGSEADLAGRDVAGKVAVIRTEPEPMFFNDATLGIPRLAAAGAVGVVRLHGTPGNMQILHGYYSDIPCFNVGGEDSDFVEAAISQANSAGEVENLGFDIALEAETEVRQARELVARIPGRSSAENVVLVAHADGWFGGGQRQRDRTRHAIGPR